MPGGRALMKACGFVESEATLVMEAPDIGRLRTAAARILEASQAMAAGQGTAMLTDKVHHIEDADQFDALIERSEGRLVVIDFFAEWCGPCKMIAPVFESMAKEFSTVVFLKVDVDKQIQHSLCEGISAMPTFRFVKGGQTVDELQGADTDGIRTRIFTHMN